MLVESLRPSTWWLLCSSAGGCLIRVTHYPTEGTEKLLFSDPFIYFHLLCTSEAEHISHVVWQGLQDIPSCSEGERERWQAEKPLSIIQSTPGWGVWHFGAVSNPARPQSVSAMTRPQWSREKLPGEQDGKGGNEKTHETKKCIISKIGNPFWWVKWKQVMI